MFFVFRARWAYWFFGSIFLFGAVCGGFAATEPSNCRPIAVVHPQPIPHFGGR